MWAPDQWKVNKGKIVIRRSQSSTIATTMAVHSKIHTQLDIGILADVSIFETGFGRFDFNNI